MRVSPVDECVINRSNLDTMYQLSSRIIYEGTSLTTDCCELNLLASLEGLGGAGDFGSDKETVSTASLEKNDSSRVRSSFGSVLDASPIRTRASRLDS